MYIALIVDVPMYAAEIAEVPILAAILISFLVFLL